MSSVLNQTYTNYEVLYINDTSTDNTLNKINELKSNYNLDNWTIINNLTNKGAASILLWFWEDVDRAIFD